MYRSLRTVSKMRNYIIIDDGDGSIEMQAVQLWTFLGFNHSLLVLNYMISGVTKSFELLLIGLVDLVCPCLFPLLPQAYNWRWNLWGWCGRGEHCTIKHTKACHRLTMQLKWWGGHLERNGMINQKMYFDGSKYDRYIGTKYMERKNRGEKVCTLVVKFRRARASKSRVRC